MAAGENHTTVSNEGIHVLLLAAGSSSRMGRPKQLLKIGNENLLQISVGAALQSRASRCIVVLGSRESEMRKSLASLGPEVISNPHWENGMGSTLKFGLIHILNNHPDLEAVIVMVCDQPMITHRQLDAIIQKYKNTLTPIIASHYGGTDGVPALFGKDMFPFLLNITDDQGAKKIIQQHPALVSSIPFPQGITDLDTPEDYETFLKDRK